MDSESPHSRCSHCGAPLSGEVPGHLCLRCLLRLGLNPAAGTGETSPAETAPPEATETFERYRVLEKIGEGGCGVVYRAEQLSPVRREVALKVIKLGMDTHAVVARFEAERQALALMDHPHIARVFDAGATRGGRPFFAMELVAGERITDYCDRNELSLRERLELFIQVCHAIQHAHQKGVIHRDIKPSNILVVERDGRATPKVIDFGVAKATARQRLADQSLYTAFDQFIGTPGYMSPEQAGVAGDDVDTRSDIYSLGVLLYELLTGQPPFEHERLRQAALDEVCRIIREEEPVRPSARLAALTPEKLAEVARSRVLHASRLSGEVRGDLDWLVMKALEKDRARRYATANDLAADVRRFLAHEPIAAGPPTAFYRLRKFARRNRGTVISIGAVVITLLAGLALSLWLYSRERVARYRAEARAYASDMGLAARMVSQPVGLGGADRLLSAWQDHRPDPRGWEWYYLNGLCHQEELIIQSEGGALNSVAWNADGTRLAAGGSSGSVRIWDALNGALIVTLNGHTGAVNAVAWHSDGQLASCGEDGAVRIWDAQRATQLKELRTPDAKFVSLAWSPDGRTIAAGGRGGAIRRWDVASGKELKTLRGKRAADALSWSPEGSQLAAVGGGELLMVWDVVNGTELLGREPRQGSGGFHSVAWSPDGRRLVTGGDDFTVKLFDPATGTNTLTLWGHRSGIFSVAWNSAGTRIASADQGDGTVRIWDVADARMVRSFRGHRGPAKAVAWCPSGSRLASAGSDGTLRVWDASRDNRSLRLLHHPGQVWSLAWHPDDRQLAASGRHDAAAIWDTRHSVRPVDLSAPVNWVWRVVWKSDGSRLATVGDDNVIRLWDPAGREVGRLHAPGGGVRGLAWSPDGSRLAFTGASSGLRLWDAQSTNATLLHDLGRAASFDVAWSPDGRRVAAVAGYQVIIVEAYNGSAVVKLIGHVESVRSLAWSPDGNRLASASDDALVKIWDARTGRELLTLTGYSTPVWAVDWSPDGTRLATGGWDGIVKLWDPTTGVELCSFSDHPAQAVAVAFSHDGSRLASSDLDGNIFIRDATPGRETESRRRAVTVINDPPDASPAGGTNAFSPSDELLPLAWFRDKVRVRADAGDLDSMHTLAGVLAISSHPELRDGRKAVEYGERAAAITHRNNAGVLDNLAAAYAEAGDFANAVAVQNEAIALLNGPIAKAEFTTRLRLYESNQPCRDYNW